MAYQQQMMIRYQMSPAAVNARIMPNQSASWSGGNPFGQSAANTHSGFNPTRSYNNADTGGQPVSIPIPKPPKPPEKPLVPYMRFSRKMWQKVRAENSERQLWDIGKIIGQLWRELGDGEKAVYQQEYETEKVEYDKTLKAYHNSAAYQAFLASKNRAKMLEKEQRPTPQHHQHHLQSAAESGVVIQPVDEDDGQSQVWVRRVAAARYERNHHLVADLFSPNLVQDTRSVVTQGRIDMLRKQAQSLAMHQGKLEQELCNLEEKFEAKKRRIEEAGQNFAVKLKEVCEQKPNIDECKYQEMVKKASERLMEAYEKYKERQEEAEKKRQEEEEQRQRLNGSSSSESCPPPAPPAAVENGTDEKTPQPTESEEKTLELKNGEVSDDDDELLDSEDD